MASATNVYINTADRPIYNKLKYNDGPFKGKKNKEIFITAVVLGYYKTKTRSELISPTEQYDEIENLGPERRSIIKAIAVADEGIEILSDKIKVYTIAEEYASTGIKILESMVYSNEFDFTKKLESILVEEYDKQRMDE